MKRVLLILLICSLWAGLVEAAVRYVTTTVACTGNYSIANNNCTGTGSGLNSYTTIAAALSASAAGDTIRMRGAPTVAGSYPTPTGGLWPLANQIWESCRTAPCASNELATITASGSASVINFDHLGSDNAANVTFRNFAVSGGIDHAIVAGGMVNNLTIDGLTISGWNTGGATGVDNGRMAIQYNNCSLIIAAGQYCTSVPTGLIIRNTTIQSPATTGVEVTGIHLTNAQSGGLIENNTISGVGMGIWLDVHVGDPVAGYTRYTVQNNVVSSSNICYHAEVGSSWILQKNIGYGCNEGIRVRPASGTSGHRVYNNTLYAVATGLWVSNDGGSEIYTDNVFKNNIFVNNSSTVAAIVISDDHITDGTNLFENNLMFNRSTGPAVCWGDLGPGFSLVCDTPGVTYADSEAGIDAWNAAATNVSYTGGMATTSWFDPLFANAAGNDFRLCTAAGQPIAGCTGASPALNAGVNIGFPFLGAAPDLGALEASSCTAPLAGSPVAMSTFACIDMVPATIEHHGCASGANATERANCVGWNEDPQQADMWMLSWASDGNVYGLWGDGRGWNGTIADGAIGASAITDDPPTMAATDVYTEGSRSPNYKARSFIADSGSVMRGFYELESDSWDHAFALSSANNGTSWTFTGTQVFSKTTHGLAVIAMAQSGQGYTGTLPAGLSDSYYYVYLGCWTGGGGCADSTHLYLARVPKASWNTFASYEWFNGVDSGNTPIWSASISSKTAIFTDTNGATASGQTGVFYNPYWNRWILSTAHTTAGCTTNEPCRLGIFESPFPWGPWKTLYYGDFLDTFWKFSYQTPQKWMAANGLSYWMSYSGWPEYDNVNVIRVDATLASTGSDTLAPGPPTNLRVAAP